MRALSNKRWLPLVAVVAVLLVFFLYRAYAPKPSYPAFDQATLTPYVQSEDEVPNYFTYLDRLPEFTVNAAQKETIIEAAAFTAAEEGTPLSIIKGFASASQALLWDGGSGWVEWEVEVPAEGLYTMEVAYEPREGSFASIMRGIQVDGEYPFAEAERLTLPRNWKDAVYPYKKDDLGNELRPVTEQITSVMKEPLVDFTIASEPLVWHLSSGKHTLRMVGQREPVALASISIVPYTPPLSYSDYRSMNNGAISQEGNNSEGWYALLEAEGYARKSDPGIQTSSYSEPHISPDPKGRTAYNVLGGDRWKKAGEWVEWDVEVPLSGFYELELKYLQSMQTASTYHTITIDGETPFSELLAYEKTTNNSFQLHPLQGESGEPFQIYLEAGKRKLRITANASPVTPAVYALQDMLQELSQLDKNMRRITGNYSATGADQDLNRTWEIKRYDPEIEAKLELLIEQSEAIAAYVDGLSRRQTPVSSALKVALSTYREMLEDVNEIPNQMKEFSRIQSSLGTWISQMAEQKMMLDYIVLKTPGTDTGLQESTALSRASYMGIDFFRTFYMDYSRKSLNKEKALTVWVGRGRDYVDIMQEMIDQQFTPQTGIPVNVNLMPNPNALILGNAAGDQPDVALGIATETAIEYAMRGAIADLAQFDNFEEVLARFHPGVMRAHQYDGGTYALPELQNFQLMYYRTDVFEQLGMEPPDTWEDVFRMMPTLLEKGMTFYYPPGDFATIFYQNGAEFWDRSGMSSYLGDTASANAFKQWTDMFTKHSLPLEIPAFFEHFRLGDLPIGIGDLNTYVQLSVAAPDIIGQWAVAPIPGVRQADGTVARWSQQGTVSGMIMKKSDKYDEAWDFLDWWTSEQVQAEFGNSMESLYGLEYRWNTANIDAMASIPWSDSELEALHEQARWVKNVPLVPGHYFLGRELGFAWNSTVLSGEPFMEALEKARISLQREMWRKQKDLGLPADTDLGIVPYTTPFSMKARE